MLNTGVVSCYDTSEQPPKALWVSRLNNYLNSNVTMRLLGGNLLVAAGGQLILLNARNGTSERLYELTSNLEANLTSMTVHRNLVISNSTHRLVAVSRDKFKRVWKSGDMGERFECSQMCGNYLFVAVDGEVHAVDLNTGQSVFSEAFEGPRRAITLLADETTNPGQPLLYVGHCGKVYIIDVNARKRLEKELLVCEDDTFGVSLALWRGILLASAGGLTTGFVTSTHEPAWLLQYGHETGYGFMTSMHCFIHGGLDICVIGSNGYVVAADIKTGKQLWLTSLPRSGFNFVSTLFYDSVLYVASYGKLWAINIDSGEFTWDLPLTSLGTHSPILLSTISRNDMASDTPIIQAQKRTPAFSLFR